LMKRNHQSTRKTTRSREKKTNSFECDFRPRPSKERKLEKKRKKVFERGRIRAQPKRAKKKKTLVSAKRRAEKRGQKSGRKKAGNIRSGARREKVEKDANVDFTKGKGTRERKAMFLVRGDFMRRILLRRKTSSSAGSDWKRKAKRRNQARRPSAIHARNQRRNDYYFLKVKRNAPELEAQGKPKNWGKLPSGNVLSENNHSKFAIGDNKSSQRSVIQRPITQNDKTATMKGYEDYAHGVNVQKTSKNS